MLGEGGRSYRAPRGKRDSLPFVVARASLSLRRTFFSSSLHRASSQGTSPGTDWSFTREVLRRCLRGRIKLQQLRDAKD